MRRPLKNTRSWDCKKAIVWFTISFFAILYGAYFTRSVQYVLRNQDAMHYAALVMTLLLVVITFLLFMRSKGGPEAILKNQHIPSFEDESPVYPYCAAEAVPSSHENQTNPYPSFTLQANSFNDLATHSADTAEHEDLKMIRAVIEAIEKERRSIGQELHDHINQILATALLTIDMARDPIHGENFLRATKEHIRLAIDEIRKLSHKMAPAILDDSTLKQLFEDLLQNVNPTGTLETQLEFDECINSRTSEDIQVNLYRILQEQLKNILKYAGASRITVSVLLRDDMVQMRTVDNGKGFHPAAVKSGIGLSNMRKRAISFGGTININSAPGKGCEIIVEIPCTEKL